MLKMKALTPFSIFHILIIVYITQNCAIANNYTGIIIMTSCGFQVHFPVFVGSSIYLRFLSELIQMLNKDEGPTSLQGDGSSKVELHKKATLKLSHIVTGRDLDDPNSLWERPALLYAWHSWLVLVIEHSIFFMHENSSYPYNSLKGTTSYR